MAFTPTLPARHPDAAVIVPPHCTAVLSEMAATAPTARPSPPVHHREGPHGLADSLRLQQVRQGRGGDRAMERWKQAIGDGCALLWTNVG
jgi:hypothetical protein